MKKALQITLSGVLFTIEEDAYDKLRTYLDETKAYFAAYNDGEIMKDIEARIAEQLMEKKDSIITIGDIDKLIDTMGKVEDFKSEGGAGPTHTEDTSSQSAGEARGRRKLFKNPDDVVIAGVASGIAAYFAIDPLIVRVIFILLSFGSGTGILIYIILALILPKAETPADKLLMYGGPVSLDSFKKNIGDHADTIKKNSRDLYRTSSSGFRNLVERLIDLFGKLIRVAIKVVGAIAGALAIFVSAAVLFGVTFALINLIFNINSPYIEVPISQAIGSGAYYSLLLFGYILAIIPVIFVIGTVISLFKRKFVFRSSVLGGLGGVWIVSGIIFGTLLIHSLPQIREQITTSPQYQSVTRTEELSGFTKLDVHDFAHVHLVQSPEFSVVAEGTQAEISALNFKVDNGTLVINQSTKSHFCIICFGNWRRSSVTISMPTTTDITLHDATMLDTEALRADAVNITLHDASHGIFNLLTTKSATVTLGDASHLTLTGSTTALTATTHDASHFDGAAFPTQTAIAEATDVSHIDIDALKTLQATASDIGRIRYSGNPRVTIKTSDMGKVSSQSGSDVKYTASSTNSTNPEVEL